MHDCAPLLHTLIGPVLVTIYQRLRNDIHCSGIHARVEVPPGTSLPGLFWLVSGAGALVQCCGCDNVSYQILLDTMFHCLTPDMR